MYQMIRKISFPISVFLQTNQKLKYIYLPFDQSLPITLYSHQHHMSQIISSSIRNLSFLKELTNYCFSDDNSPYTRQYICIHILAIMEGYPTFVISILMIGANTALIGDIAGHLGCFIYLKDCVNAIAFVALGTSVPGRTRARGLWNN